MRRRSFLAAAGLGAAGVLAGCAAPTGWRSPADGPVRAATYIPKSYDDLYPGVEATLDAVTRSGGPAFDLFDGGTLLGAEQLLPGLLLGAADLVFQTSSYVSSSFPALGAMELPFATEDYARHRRVFDPDGPLVALVNDELAEKDVRLLGGMPLTYEYFWTVDRPIRRPEDVAGLRMRVAGEIEGETVKALGGAPVSMGSAEVYEALQRGTIDGMLSYLGTVVSRDLQSILRYGTRCHIGSYTFDAYCRASWYDALDPRTRAALDAGGRALYRDGTATMVAVHQDEYLPEVVAGGVEIVDPTPSELAALRAATEPVRARWEDALGKPAVSARMAEIVRTA